MLIRAQAQLQREPNSGSSGLVSLAYPELNGGVPSCRGRQSPALRLPAHKFFRLHSAFPS